jgi:HEAT repeat protein
MRLLPKPARDAGLSHWVYSSHMAEERSEAPIREVLGQVVAEATSAVADDDGYWDAVRRLHRFDRAEVRRLVQPFAESADPRMRALVADTLRGFSHQDDAFAAALASLLADMLTREHDPIVLAAIGCALGETKQPTAVAAMLPFAGHADANVRFSVVASLLTHHDPRAIDALIQLSRDSDDDVRDWATFGLGSQLGEPGDPELVDTPAIRDALFARIDDPHDDTRWEAIVGLAMRRDSRALGVLVREVEGDCEHSLLMEAARYMAAPELCGGLRALAASDSRDFWLKNGLEGAIAACCAGC